MTERNMQSVIVQNTADSWMNLNNKKSAFYDLMETLLSLLLFIPGLALVVYLVSKDAFFIYRAYLSILFVLYFWAVRDYINKNLLYILSFVPAFIVIYYMTWPLIEKIPFIIYIALEAIFSVRKRIKSIAEYHNFRYLVFGNIVLAIEFIISSVQGAEGIPDIIIMHSIVFSLLCMIYIHITRTKKLMEWEKQTSREAVSRINRASGIFLFYLSLIFIFISLIILWGGLAGLGQGIIYAIISFLRNLFSIRPDVGKNQGLKVQDGGQDIKELLESIKTGEPSAFLKAVVFIIEVILGCLAAGVILICFYLLIRLLYQAIRSFIAGRRGNDGEQESLFNIKDVVEDIKERFKVLKKGFQIYGLPNNRRIRKMYYKIVMNNKKSETVIEKFYTPHTIEYVLKKDSDKDISEVTDIYERARYGRWECREEDVAKIKKMKP